MVNQLVHFSISLIWRILCEFCKCIDRSTRYIQSTNSIKEEEKREKKKRRSCAHGQLLSACQPIKVDLIRQSVCRFVYVCVALNVFGVLF